MGVLLESSPARLPVTPSMVKPQVKQDNMNRNTAKRPLVNTPVQTNTNMNEPQGSVSCLKEPTIKTPSVNKENLTENPKNMDALDKNKVSKSKKRRMKKKKKTLAAHVSNLLDKKLRLDAKAENECKECDDHQPNDNLEISNIEIKSIDEKCTVSHNDCRSTAIFTSPNRNQENLDNNRIKMHIFDNYVNLEVDVRDKLKNDPNIRFEGDEFLVTVRSGNRRAIMSKTLPAGCITSKTVSYLNSDRYMVVKIPRRTNLPV